MSINEGYPSNSGETDSAESSDNNGWSNFPPFNGGEKPAEDTSEISEENQSESGESLDDEDMEYIDTSKIDISSNQGKYEWLNALTKNAQTYLSEQKLDILRDWGLPIDTPEAQIEELMGDDEEYRDIKRSMEVEERQSRILENIYLNEDGDFIDSLKRRMDTFEKVSLNPNVSSEKRDDAFENWSAATKLYSTLADEMARRDPEYFGNNEIKSALRADIRDAEKRVEETKIDAYYDQDGSLHYGSNGEKMPSSATEDAEIDLKNAKQDAATFDLLMNEYYAANNYDVPSAIKKEDFAPTIDKFIEDHTLQINQLVAESRSLDKKSPEFAENISRRKQLAKERSSAKRLSVRYFTMIKVNSTTPRSPETPIDDDGMSMEQMPTGKTKEQIEAEASEKKRKEEEEYQKRVNEYWEQKRQAEQKQREENERQIRARQEAEAERQRQIREAEEATRRNVNQQQIEEEQEEEMSM